MALKEFGKSQMAAVLKQHEQFMIIFVGPSHRHRFLRATLKVWWKVPIIQWSVPGANALDITLR